MTFDQRNIAHPEAVVIEAQRLGGRLHLLIPHLHRDLREGTVAGVGERLGEALGAVRFFTGDRIALDIEGAAAVKAHLIDVGDILDRCRGGDDLKDRAGRKARRDHVIEIHAVVLAHILLGDLRRIGRIVARGAGIAQHLARLIVVDDTAALMAVHGGIRRTAGSRVHRQLDVGVGAQRIGDPRA